MGGLLNGSPSPNMGQMMNQGQNMMQRSNQQPQMMGQMPQPQRFGNQRPQQQMPLGPSMTYASFNQAGQPGMTNPFGFGSAYGTV
jgi:hypothetical protein